MNNSKGKPQANQSLHHVVVPLSVYHKVFGTLIALTILTIASSYIDFGGSTNILIAMLVATTKALLVVLFFMGLKYDGQENNVTFFCSFVFLTIFVSLTSADLFYRSEQEPAKVDASEMVQAAEPVDVAKLVTTTPELIAKGKAIFGQQCLSCHGAEGQGNGPAAAALSPKPRNFTSAEGWKNGRAVTQIFKTLAQGVPGSAMPAFTVLPPEDRFALAHYVRSLGPAAPPSDPQEVAALQKELGVASKPRISIQRAMEIVEQESQLKH